MLTTPGQSGASAIGLMSDSQLQIHMQILVVQLEVRQWGADAPPGICRDLFDVSQAVQKALIANNCLP